MGPYGSGSNMATLNDDLTAQVTALTTATTNVVALVGTLKTNSLTDAQRTTLVGALQAQSARLTALVGPPAPP